MEALRAACQGEWLRSSGRSVPTDLRRITRTMGSARTVLPCKRVDYSGNDGRNGWRKNLTGPPARRNLVHTERNALPVQVDLGSDRRRPTVDRSRDLGMAVIARVGAGLDQRGAVRRGRSLGPRSHRALL